MATENENRRGGMKAANGGNQGPPFRVGLDPDRHVTDFRRCRMTGQDQKYERRIWIVSNCALLSRVWGHMRGLTLTEQEEIWTISNRVDEPFFFDHFARFLDRDTGCVRCCSEGR